jgi:two-component system KDP operon response regulator KdpE
MTPTSDSQGNLFRAVCTILVSEDDPSVRALLREALVQHGYHVLVAESLAEAASVAAAVDHRIDLLLTDMGMPDGTGHELVARLRAGRPDLKVLLMSGLDPVATGTPLVTGADPFLSKPFGLADLFSQVRSLLGDGSAQPAAAGLAPAER